MALSKKFIKTLSKSDVKSKFVVKEKWLREEGLLNLPGNLEPGSQTSIPVVDEEGREFKFVLKVRSRDTGIDLNIEPIDLNSKPKETITYYRKPEFMAKGWQVFVKEKGLTAGRTISFERDPDTNNRIRILIEAQENDMA